MRRAAFLIAVLVAASLLLLPARSWAVKQSVALFPLHAAGLPEGTSITVFLEKEIAGKLGDRFDVQLVDRESVGSPADRVRQARILGATYVITGNIARIGRVASLDLTLAPTEDPGKGRTVFVTADGAGRAEGGNPGVPPAYGELAAQAAEKLKVLFFGDGRIGDNDTGRAIPSPSGQFGRSRNIPGKVIAVAAGDTDRDGRREIAAAYPDSIVIYRVEGEDLAEKARIPDPRKGLFHIDLADVNRNGTADVIAVRYLSGRALSDVWEFDGKRYRRILADVPFFLRKMDLGPEGVVVAGQESDPETIFRGPAFRVAIGGSGDSTTYSRAGRLPLPPGLWLYAFVPVKFHGGIRYVALGAQDGLVLYDGSGRRLWEGMDAVTGPGYSLEPEFSREGRPAQQAFSMPGRLLAADLSGDGADEVIVVNNVVSGGGFFENVRIRTHAEILCFGQTEGSLDLAWRTPQIEGSGEDAFLDIERGKRPFRVGVASRDPAKVLGNFGEWRLYWVK